MLSLTADGIIVNYVVNSLLLPIELNEVGATTMDQTVKLLW